MPQHEDDPENATRGLTERLAEDLGEDPTDIERQADELEIEDPWDARKD